MSTVTLSIQSVRMVIICELGTKSSAEVSESLPERGWHSIECATPDHLLNVHLDANNGLTIRTGP